jgi:hypothetical protein
MTPEQRKYIEQAEWQERDRYTVEAPAWVGVCFIIAPFFWVALAWGIFA